MHPQVYPASNEILCQCQRQKRLRLPVQNSSRNMKQTLLKFCHQYFKEIMLRVLYRCLDAAASHIGFSLSIRLLTWIYSFMYMVICISFNKHLLSQTSWWILEQTWYLQSVPSWDFPCSKPFYDLPTLLFKLYSRVKEMHWYNKKLGACMKRLGKLASYFFSGKLLNYTKACENKFPPKTR